MWLCMALPYITCVCPWLDRWRILTFCNSGPCLYICTIVHAIGRWLLFQSNPLTHQVLWIWAAQMHQCTSVPVLSAPVHLQTRSKQNRPHQILHPGTCLGLDLSAPLSPLQNMSQFHPPPLVLRSSYLLCNLVSFFWNDGLNWKWEWHENKNCSVPAIVGFPEKAWKILNHPTLLASRGTSPWKKQVWLLQRTAFVRQCKLFIFGEETHLSLTVLGNVSIANSSIPVLYRERWSSDNSAKFDDALHRFVR